MGQQALCLGKAAKLRIPCEELVAAQAGQRHGNTCACRLRDKVSIDTIATGLINGLDQPIELTRYVFAGDHYFGMVGAKDEKGSFLYRDRFYSLTPELQAEYTKRVVDYTVKLSEDLGLKRK